MSQRKSLLTIDYHTDDDTGMYDIGEIDFGIRDLSGYLERYGSKGKDDIIRKLSHLIYRVEDRFQDIHQEQARPTSAN